MDSTKRIFGYGVVDNAGQAYFDEGCLFEDQQGAEELSCNLNEQEARTGSDIQLSYRAVILVCEEIESGVDVEDGI